MQESERRQRVISSTPHMSADEVANRSFSKKARGFAEPEVRVFLKRVSEELVAARERERELLAAIDALEEQLRTPPPLSEQDLLDALGEETARLLRSAREASDDIRAKAEERAARLVDEASSAAEQTRAEAAEILAARTQQGEAKAAEMVAHAEARATELREAAAAEVVAIVEQARAQGREMLDEAKSARERVLGDLVRRRALLQAQIEELRGGRDRLIDAYRTVKRTFLDATEALAHVEVRAAAERATPAEPLDVAAEIAAEIALLDEAGEGAGAVGETEPAVDIDLVAAEREAGADADTDADAETKLADVDSLFARLRAGHGDETAPTATGQSGEAESVSEGEAASVPEASRVNAEEWRARRSGAIDPLVGPLVKRVKRSAQDDQNALLDAVRRFKGRPSAQQVMPDAEGGLEHWAGVLREAVDAAYGAGLAAAGALPAAAPADFAREAAESLTIPLRERVTAAIDSGDAGDTGGLVERIGARFREWKNQSLEPTLAEVLSSSWSRGVYDAMPDGATLWWLPLEEGRCSDCDDNALEPTVKGKQFPTGQAFPPAHPGCRCMLAPDVLIDAPKANA